MKKILFLILIFPLFVFSQSNYNYWRFKQGSIQPSNPNYGLKLNYNQTPIQADDYVLGIGTDGLVTRRAVAFLPNIYTTDGTLLSDRVINGDSNDLTFNNIDLLNLSATTVRLTNQTSIPFLSTDANGNIISANTGTTNSYFWSLNGNEILSGNFIGTTNAEDVLFKRNNLNRLRLGIGSTNGSGVYLSNYANITATKTGVPLGFDPASGELISIDNRDGDWTEVGTTMYNQNKSYIGVGTTNPLAKFEISDPSRNPLTATGDKNNYQLVIAGSTNTGIGRGIGFAQTDNNVGSAIISIDQGAFARSDLAFYTKETGSAGNLDERMRILWTGEIGIGTTTPSNALEINSTIVNESGLTFTQMNSASPTVANAKAIGVDATGKVVPIDTSVGGVPCYQKQTVSMTAGTPLAISTTCGEWYSVTIEDASGEVNYMPVTRSGLNSLSATASVTGTYTIRITGIK